MDIIASIFAYLTCVAGIIGAFLFSFYMVFATPSEPSLSKNRGAIVSASQTKPVAVAQTKTTTDKTHKGDKRSSDRVASANSKREPAAMIAAKTEAAPSTPTPVADSQKLATSDALQKDARQKPMSRAQWRRIVEEERARRHLAYQQSSDFQSRFLGYAN